MKKTLIALALLLCLVLTACSGWGEKFPITAGYEGLEDAVKKDASVAVIRYDRAPKDYTVSDPLGSEVGDHALVFPRYVGSHLDFCTIKAMGPDDFEQYGEVIYSVDVKEDTVISIDLYDLGANKMWYLKVSAPDGESFGTPIPYPCETDKDLVYVGEDWDGKDCFADNWSEEEEIMPTLKPVIYLYPEEETQVEVDLDYCGELTCTYPKYKQGWTVTAQPDGTLTDEQGKEYNYLYWEGVGYDNFDFSKGFCIAGEDTAAFLEKALEALGLTRREANEFIVFWLPMMEQNPYNVISFQTETYEEAAKLHISPKPDSLIRVFMAWYGSQEAVELPEQQLIAPNREGFTVVEWGGSEAK